MREAWKYADWTEDGYPYIAYRADDARKLVEDIPAEWGERISDIWADLSTDEKKIAADKNWRSSLHMPRWASRITLEVTDVRVERVQDISNAGIAAEGWLAEAEDQTERAKAELGMDCDDACVEWFAALWDKVNPAHPWDSNPWVWVYTFSRTEAQQ